MAPQAASSAVAPQILFFLRFIQQGSLVLTGFVAIYFVYWHVLLVDPVPAQLIAAIVAVRSSVPVRYLY